MSWAGPRTWMKVTRQQSMLGVWRKGFLSMFYLSPRINIVAMQSALGRNEAVREGYRFYEHWEQRASDSQWLEKRDKYSCVQPTGEDTTEKKVRQQWPEDASVEIGVNPKAQCSNGCVGRQSLALWRQPGIRCLGTPCSKTGEKSMLNISRESRSLLTNTEEGSRKGGS